MIHIKLNIETNEWIVDQKTETIVQNSLRKNLLFIEMPGAVSENYFCSLSFLRNADEKPLPALQELQAIPGTREFDTGEVDEETGEPIMEERQGFNFLFSSRLITAQAGVLYVSANIYRYKDDGSDEFHELDENDREQIEYVASFSQLPLIVSPSVVVKTLSDEDEMAPISKAQYNAIFAAISQNSRTIKENRDYFIDELSNYLFLGGDNIAYGKNTFTKEVVFELSESTKGAGFKVVESEEKNRNIFSYVYNKANMQHGGIVMVKANEEHERLMTEVILPSKSGTLALDEDLQQEHQDRITKDNEQDLLISGNTQLVRDLNEKANDTLDKVNAHMLETKGKLLTDISYDYSSENGVLSMTFTFEDNSAKTINIDLPTEYTVSNAYMDKNELVIVFNGGAVTRVDMSKLIGDTLHKDSDTIEFETNANHEVRANIKEKSLDSKYFTDEFNAELNELINSQSKEQEIQRQANEAERQANEVVRMTQEEARQEGFAEMSEKFSGFEGAVRLTKSEYEALADKEDKFYFVIED